MSDKPNITIIGAASTTFGPKVLRDLINHPQLDGCTLRFVDIHAERLEIYTRLARRINEQMAHSVVIESGTDRREMLAGADYVIISVETLHYDLWEQDFTIPNRFGIRQVTGELGGPGGLFHSLRQIPMHLEIARDIEALCPEAMVMICSNPLNRLCLALERYAHVGQIVGLCHGVEITENFVFAKLLGIDGEDIETTAAGTNHFTWILDVRRRSTGENLYPELRQKLAEAKDARGSLSRKLMDVYGYYPACGDGHIGEYIPYAWEFVGLDGPGFDRRTEQEAQRWEYLDKLSRGAANAADLAAIQAAQADQAEELRLGEFFQPRSWVDTLAFPVMAAIASNTLQRLPALNLINRGTIRNLPDEVFVETPAVVDASGIRPVAIGDLPAPLAAFNRRDIDQMELTVEAAVTGDRKLVLQAMMLDPVVDSVSAVEKVIDEMLRTQEKYLPQFH